MRFTMTWDPGPRRIEPLQPYVYIPQTYDPGPQAGAAGLAIGVSAQDEARLLKVWQSYDAQRAEPWFVEALGRQRTSGIRVFRALGIDATDRPRSWRPLDVRQQCGRLQIPIPSEWQGFVQTYPFRFRGRQRIENIEHHFLTPLFLLKYFGLTSHHHLGCQAELIYEYFAEHGGTTEERPFYRAILADEWDTTPRRIFSDWLEEQGDARKAELMRVADDPSE